MSENYDAPQGAKQESSLNAVPISDIFFMTLRHWPWILLSVFVCVGLAYVYLLRTPNVYTRSAEILIKDDSKGKSVGPEDFADFGFFQSNTNIQNEMTNLMAKDLMEEVVRRLRLDMNYYHDGQFHDEVAYGTELPVNVDIAGIPDQSELSFNLDVTPAGEVTISKLESPDEDLPKSRYTGRLNDSIATPVGEMIVTPTEHFVHDEAISLKVRRMPIEVATASYNRRLNVTMSKEKGTVLKLVLADPSVARADAVLSTLINVYNENWIRDKNQIAVSTSNFINDRLGVIEGELGNVDSDISSYKSANLVPDVSAAASMYMSQSQQTQAQMLELNNQLQMTRYIRSYLTSDAHRDQLLPANTGIENTNIQSLISDYNNRLLQRNALVAKSSDKNPLVKQLDDQLAQQRQAVVQSIDNEIISLNTQIKALRGSEAETLSRIASNPKQAKNLLSVERQQKVKESLYLFLLQKREENELSQAFTAYNTRIINRPGASGTPPSPNRKMILLLAFIVGLAIPFGVTYVRETFNTRVRGRKDIEHLKLPFLGEIPMSAVRGKSKADSGDQSKRVVVRPGRRDIINEAFRVLRTNLEFMKSNKNGCDVIAVTSFNPGSGKSFLTCNLGATLALKNQRVLVIDGDMRHGSTSAYVNSPSKGLADYLNGTVSDVNSVIVHEKEFPTLGVLPIGTVPPNPTELLESERFPELIKALRPDYDYILIDCPPIEVVADAQIIDMQADRTIFVLRAGLLERNMLPQLEKIYDEKKYHNMAIILNATSLGHGHGGYSHAYRYGYGYGYGYGYNYGDQATKTDKATKWLKKVIKK